MKFQTNATQLIAAIFIFLFTYTASAKLFSFASFRSTLGRLPLIGHFSSALAVGLPLLELTVSALLFFPKSRLLGLYASLILMAIFTIYIGYSLLSGSNLPCSCGGVIQNLSWREHLLLNFTLTSLAAVGLRLQMKISREKMKFLLQ